MCSMKTFGFDTNKWLCARFKCMMTSMLQEYLPIDKFCKKDISEALENFKPILDSIYIVILITD